MRRIRMEDRQHGLIATYRAGCHCLECRAAKNKKDRDRRRRLARDHPSAWKPLADTVESVVEAQNPMLRPRWYPPPCPSCNGYGYVQHPHGWTQCRSCPDHPGHACTHAEWMMLRA